MRALSPHTRARLPRQGKARLVWHGMAWHGLVGCACALSFTSHFGGHLPQMLNRDYVSSFVGTHLSTTATLILKKFSSRHIKI